MVSFKALSTFLAVMLVLSVAQECANDSDQVDTNEYMALIQSGVHQVSRSFSSEALPADADSKPIAKHASVEAVHVDASVKPVPITDKGLGDPRLYQGATLANGLQVLNIQDKNSLDSAMAMGVLAGSYDDPKELPGLAHFCEHMLFLGSKKYPGASDFDKFLSQHGGSSNAFTASELTDYFFQTSSSSAVEIMPRFADWFSQPLFNRTYVEKEVHAINSENSKNVEDPGWRINAMMDHLANPKSPVSWFSTGNIDTLLNEPKKKGIDTVTELRKYFKDHYCPPKMRLVTFGPTSLAEQFAAAEKAFGNISAGSAKCQAPISWAKPPAWPKDRLGKFVTILGTQPQEELRLMFPTPDTTAEYASRPEAYLNYVFSYAGMNSLSLVLSDTLNLISDLQVSHDTSSASGEFYISLVLTPTGRRHYGVVLDLVFSYIATVLRAGIDKELYQSLKDLTKLKFDWAGLPGASSTVESFAEAMKDMKLPDVVWGGDRINALNVPLVNSLLKLLTPDNMIAALITPGAEKDGFSNQTVHTLPYYGVKYSEQSLEKVLPGHTAKWQSWLDGKKSKSLIAEALNHDLTENIKLSPLKELPLPPGPIVGIPQHIPLANMHAEVSAEDKGSLAAIFGSIPKLLPLHIDNTQQEVWYRSGWMTNSPQVKISTVLRPLRKQHDPEASAQESGEFSLYNMLLGKEMTPKMVDLTVTGVSYGLTISSDGLSFTFSGFTPSLPILIKQVLQGYNNFTKDGAKLTPNARWEHTKDEYRMALKTYSGMPMTYAIQDRNMLLSSGSHSQEELLDALEKTTLESVLSVGARTTLSKPLRFTALAVGNLDETHARSSIEAVLSGAHGDKVAKMSKDAQQTSDHVERVAPIVNPALPIELRKLNPRAGDPNDVVVVTALYGVSDVQSRVIFGILGDILQTVAYDELRTQRQLGYVVNAGMIQWSNVLAVSCVVQGIKLKADDMEAAVESVYHKYMPDKLAKLTDTEFKSYVKSFKDKIIQPPTEYSEEFDKFWGPVTLTPGGECFGLDDEMLCSLRGLTSKQPLIDAWKALMEPEHSDPVHGMRKKLVVKYFAGKVPERPTSQQAEAAWKKQGVPGSATKLLQKEYTNAVLLDKADASERAKLQAAGGQFPVTMECKCDEAMKCGTTKPVTEKSSAIRTGLAGFGTLAMISSVVLMQLLLVIV